MSNYYQNERQRYAPAPPPTSHGFRASNGVMGPPPRRSTTTAPSNQSQWAPPPPNGYRSPTSPTSQALPSINTNWSSSPEAHSTRQRASSSSRASFHSPPTENILSPIKSHDTQSLQREIERLRTQLAQKDADQNEIVRQRDAFREQLGFVMVELQGTKRKLDEAHAEMDQVKSKRDKYQKQRNQFKELLVKRERDEKLRDLGHRDPWGGGRHGGSGGAGMMC